MPRVLFTVSYVIPEAKRSEYLETVAQLKQRVIAQGVAYGVFEFQSQRNTFQEVYSYKSMQEFEASDDWNDPSINELIDKVYSFAKDQKVTYTTGIEKV